MLSAYKIYNSKIFTLLGAPLLVFAVCLSGVLHWGFPNSINNVEQWTNLTNQVFYGNQDFIFSYGPLYWIAKGASQPYNIYTYWSSNIFIALILTLFWTLIIDLSLKSKSEIFLGATFVTIFGSLIFPAALFLWPIVLVFYNEYSSRGSFFSKPKYLIGAGILVGLFFYIRFFYGLMALATFTSYFLSLDLSVRRPKRLTPFIASFLISYIIIGFLIFKNADNIIQYITINNQLSFGNSIDMTLDVKNNTKTFFAVAIIFFVLNAFALKKNIKLLLPINAIFLILLKLGFSRTDHYITYFVLPMGVIAVALAFEKSKYSKLLSAICLISIYYISTTPAYPNSQTRDLLTPATDFNTSYASRMSNLYHDFVLSDKIKSIIGRNTIDIYPYNNEYAFANHLNYFHRPLFQNYMTLTPKLDAINSAFFRSKSRPKYILWTAPFTCLSNKCDSFNDLDGKYVLNEDPLTTTAILENYKAIDITVAPNTGKPLLLLKERGRPDLKSPSHLQDFTMEFGKWYTVPSHPEDVTKVIPNFRFTLFGRLLNFLFRGPVVKIHYLTDDGLTHTYRINILNSQSGVWATPLVDDFKFRGRKVSSIMFSTDYGYYFFNSFPAAWSFFPIKVHTKNSAPESSQSLTNIDGLNLKDTGETYCDGRIDLINGTPNTSNTISRNNKTLSISGWAALSAASGFKFDKILVRTSGTNGQIQYLDTKSQQRNDVAKTFSRPNLLNSGFSFSINSSSLRDMISLNISGIYNGNLYSCSNLKLSFSK